MTTLPRMSGAPDGLRQPIQLNYRLVETRLQMVRSWANLQVCTLFSSDSEGRFHSDARSSTLWGTPVAGTVSFKYLFVRFLAHHLVHTVVNLIPAPSATGIATANETFPEPQSFSKGSAPGFINAERVYAFTDFVL